MSFDFGAAAVFGGDSENSEEEEKKASELKPSADTED